MKRIAFALLMFLSPALFAEEFSVKVSSVPIGPAMKTNVTKYKNTYCLELQEVFSAVILCKDAQCIIVNPRLCFEMPRRSATWKQK
jgi:hypothetical protein